MGTLAVDFGSETVRMSGGRGRPAIAEPAVVAHRGEGAVVAVGLRAAQMCGRTPQGLTAERPFAGGGVRSQGLARALLQSMMRRAVGRTWQRPDIVIALPTMATALDQRAYQRLGRDAGAAHIRFAALPACRALGLDLPLFTARGTLIIDVGAARTSIDLVSLGAPVASAHVEGAGEDLDRAVAQALRRDHRMMIGERSAQELKHALLAGAGPAEATVHGRDMASGLPRTLTVGSLELEPLVAQFALRIALKAQQLLREATPELSADLSEDGFWLTGGGAHLRALQELLPQLLDLPVHVDPLPEASIAHGLARLLEPRIASRLTIHDLRVRRR